MVLGLVPRDQICATPNAVLGFHAAWQFDKSGARIASPSGTHDLLKTYPASVRAWIARHGGLTPNIKFVRGPDLAAIVAPCGKTYVRHPKRLRGARAALARLAEWIRVAPVLTRAERRGRNTADRAAETAYQRKNFGPSFQPAKVHKAIVPPYHSTMKGTESSAQ